MDTVADERLVFTFYSKDEAACRPTAKLAGTHMQTLCRKMSDLGSEPGPQTGPGIRSTPPADFAHPKFDSYVIGPEESIGSMHNALFHVVRRVMKEDKGRENNTLIIVLSDLEIDLLRHTGELTCIWEPPPAPKGHHLQL